MHVQDIDGDGRWRIEWYGVPCNVGNTKLEYTFVVKQYYWFELVVSNTRIPISAVSVKINGKWLDLRRSVTNTWPYYRVSDLGRLMLHSWCLASCACQRETHSGSVLLQAIPIQSLFGVCAAQSLATIMHA